MELQGLLSTLLPVAWLYESSVPHLFPLFISTPLPPHGDIVVIIIWGSAMVAVSLSKVCACVCMQQLNGTILLVCVGWSCCIVLRDRKQN